MFTVLHASDLQCGGPFLSRAAEALVRLGHGISPDVIVVSGDLTQRAKASEFRTAKALIDRLPPVPVVVTPGNHDVPLYRIWERALSPYRNWARVMSAEVDSVTTLTGATFVALNSSAPWRTVINGRLDRAQVHFARAAFEAAPSGDVRALVVHHHFVPTPGRKGGRPLPRAREHVEAFERMGADFVLGGHVHQTHVTMSSDLSPGDDAQGIPLIACGTTTSRRGRGPEAGLNSLNVVRVRAGEIEVIPHVLAPGGNEFEPASSIVFPRRSVPGRSGVSAVT